MAYTPDDHLDYTPVVEWLCPMCEVWVSVEDAHCPWCGGPRTTVDLTQVDDRRPDDVDLDGYSDDDYEDDPHILIF